jgi:hypothetical protein
MKTKLPINGFTPRVPNNGNGTPAATPVEAPPYGGFTTTVVIEKQAPVIPPPVFCGPSCPPPVKMNAGDGIQQK